jgi:hypothetical protein
VIGVGLHPPYDVGVAPRGSSFASVDGIKSYIESLGALKKIVIRNSFCCKEMTIVTMFWGVSSSDVCEWDTKASATDRRVREQLTSRRRCQRHVQAPERASEPVASVARLEASPHLGAGVRAAKMWLGSRNEIGQAARPRTSGGCRLRAKRWHRSCRLLRGPYLQHDDRRLVGAVGLAGAEASLRWRAR